MVSWHPLPTSFPLSQSISGSRRGNPCGSREAGSTVGFRSGVSDLLSSQWISPGMDKYFKLHQPAFQKSWQGFSSHSFPMNVIKNMWSPRNRWQEFWDHDGSHFRLNQQHENRAESSKDTSSWWHYQAQIHILMSRLIFSTNEVPPPEYICM